MASKLTETAIQCFHCGEDCREIIIAQEKEFCCEGCKMVYEIQPVDKG